MYVRMRFGCCLFRAIETGRSAMLRPASILDFVAYRFVFLACYLCLDEPSLSSPSPPTPHPHVNCGTPATSVHAIDIIGPGSLGHRRNRHPCLPRGHYQGGGACRAGRGGEEREGARDVYPSGAAADSVPTAAALFGSPGLGDRRAVPVPGLHGEGGTGGS